ncbi:protein NEDD1, partial [Cottoperca gobio]|uniref:Protein NEDD1 n=1 Tax=Cottoperca gobio TaxID=56716 RepID=A0A6J2P9R3_COTGO
CADSRIPGTSGDTHFGRTHVTGLELLSREGEGQQVVGRASLDIFSPVREDSHSGGNSHRKTPLSTPLAAAAARCYSPLSVFQTPSPIKEEEPFSAAAETCDSRKPDKASRSSLEGEDPTTPTLSQQTNHSQLAAPFFTPDPGLGRANGLQAQLSYESHAQGAAPPPAAGAALSAAVSSSLSQNIVEVVGQAGAAPLTSLQIHFIQNMIHETLEDFRDVCHRDIVNLQVEMVRQFYIQLNEIHGLIEKYSVNESLVEEVEKLREENRRLKTNY